MAVSKAHLGKPVTDGQRVGILAEIIKDWEDPAATPAERIKVTQAFVRPQGGGREWQARPSRVHPL
ncbi:hypothetical protein [Streptomyces cinerochromogenes]|uniref:hypothetical protein n=1 Tax=Streptomyces cinerochromogenes TaxID=66422 RepID=UPI001670FBEA|nr:hypothetical protein [Streptomyces cinerochromogenes]GGT05428.1 hypothetical protein GCM10010206_79430 [Streptomyces cinerochromogenes]